MTYQQYCEAIEGAATFRQLVVLWDGLQGEYFSAAGYACLEEQFNRRLRECK
jgi:hypothetical protein